MADIGVSMGKSGTDLAERLQTLFWSTITLERPCRLSKWVLPISFLSFYIPTQSFAGKHIFHNIQNFLSFKLSTAVAALTPITFSTMFRLTNPLNPMQILFINILIDGTHPFSISNYRDWLSSSCRPALPVAGRRSWRPRSDEARTTPQGRADYQPTTHRPCLILGLHHCIWYALCVHAPVQRRQHVPARPNYGAFVKVQGTINPKSLRIMIS